MFKIIIVGAGFAGLSAALEIKNNLRESCQITLVDQHDYQLLNFNLYEIAAAEEEFSSISELLRSIELPLAPLLDDKDIKFVQGRVVGVDAGLKRALLERGFLEYDYLVCAMGSETDFFSVSGARDHSLPLKTLKDALHMRNQLEFTLQRHRQDMTKKSIKLMIAGAGYTGVELACRLAGLKDILCWKNEYPSEKVEVVLVEAASRVIPSFSERVSRVALRRLKELGVRVELGYRISEVERNLVKFSDGQKWEYDALVWTIGCRAKNLPQGLSAPRDYKGHYLTNEYLQLHGHDNIFMLGDQAAASHQGHYDAGDTAQAAVSHARYLGEALPLLMQNKMPRKFCPKPGGYIIPLGKNWAVMDYRGWFITGRAAAFLRLFAHWRYLRGLVGPWKAFKLIWLEQEIFSRTE